jgi:glutamate-ammonia-ligase adenylyltransferase
MALTRARPLVGPAAARKDLQAIVDAVLRQERDPDVLRADVLKMRAEIAANKSPSGPLDAKLQRGGLIDCEFIIHYLQLRERIAFAPDLGPAIDGLTAAGFLPDDFRAHYDLLSRLLVAARLLAPDGQPPSEPARKVLASACRSEDFAALLQAADEARQGVATTWAETFGEPLEETL